MFRRYLEKRHIEDWFIGINTSEFYQRWEESCHILQRFSPESKLCLVESDPLLFIARFSAAVSLNYSLFLCDPHWGEREWEQVFNLVAPDIIFSEGGYRCPQIPIMYEYSTKYLRTQAPRTGKIMIPTGGSSGQVRFAIHTWETLSAAVQGFYQYFGERPVNSYCVLPLYHVSGLMQFLRSLITGGRFGVQGYKEMKQGGLLHINPHDFFISLVPTQLQHLLIHFPEWLAQFKTVLVGGAPAWESLLKQARDYQVKIALTYGMTETAAQVATLQPADFLRGLNNNGRILPHSNITIKVDKKASNFSKKEGQIVIQSQSLFKGYYGQSFETNGEFVADDWGYLDESGYLHILGRKSQKIITGGENVFPQEVEGAIWATGRVKDVCVLGVKDDYWGEVVAAVYVPIAPNITSDLIKGELVEKVAPFKCPKSWVRLSKIPRNNRGKVNVKRLRELFN